MRVDLYSKIILTAIAFLLGLSAIRPFGDIRPVQAQFDYGHLYIEPGTTILRNVDGSGAVQGKVVVDRRNGDIWGFPTRTTAPYPVVPVSHEPPVSKPMYLGRYDFSAMKHGN